MYQFNGHYNYLVFVANNHYQEIPLTLTKSQVTLLQLEGSTLQLTVPEIDDYNSQYWVVGCFSGASGGLYPFVAIDQLINEFPAFHNHLCPL